MVGLYLLRLCVGSHSAVGSRLADPSGHRWSRATQGSMLGHECGGRHDCRSCCGRSASRRLTGRYGPTLPGVNCSRRSCRLKSAACCPTQGSAALHQPERLSLPEREFRLFAHHARQLLWGQIATTGVRTAAGSLIAVSASCVERPVHSECTPRARLAVANLRCASARCWHQKERLSMHRQEGDS